MSPKAVCKLVAYYRVSTREQGESGLGLEAQRAAVLRHAEATGCEIIKEFKEVETGTKFKLDNRPKLAEAIRHCKRHKATLVIAKLDRLSRNVAFLSGLMESGVDFVACDNPNANRLTLHILAAVAENEARMIGQRTREALAAFKSGKRVPKRFRDLYPNGIPPEVVEATAGKLGAELPQCRNLTDEARAKGRERAGEIMAERAREAYQEATPIILKMRGEGSTYRAIVDALNEAGLTLVSGKPWNEVQVMRIIKRNG
jgi:DNA invertase Pin-like site-specific DNA recombinase